jgi:hypothetical protein
MFMRDIVSQEVIGDVGIRNETQMATKRLFQPN